jgi:hypothetical protein
MEWVYAGFVVLSSAILYGIALAVAALVSACYRPPCPACGRRGLTCVNWIRATVLVKGRRVPDSWSYFVCERCGAAHKLHHGKWGCVPEAERHHLQVRG